MPGGNVSVNRMTLGFKCHLRLLQEVVNPMRLRLPLYRRISSLTKSRGIHSVFHKCILGEIEASNTLDPQDLLAPFEMDGLI